LIPTCHGTLGKADPGCAEGAVKVLRFTPRWDRRFWAVSRISTSLGPFWVIFVSICPALINYDRASAPNGLRGAALVTFLKARCGSGDEKGSLGSSNTVVVNSNQIEPLCSGPAQHCPGSVDALATRVSILIQTNNRNTPGHVRKTLPPPYRLRHYSIRG